MMDNSELIGELLTAVNNEVQAIKKSVDKLASPVVAPDHREELATLGDKITALGQQIAKPAVVVPAAAAAPIDLKPITSRLETITTRLGDIETQIQSQVNPKLDNKAFTSELVKVAAITIGSLVVILLLLGYLATTWREERNRFEASDWKWRNVRLRYAWASEWDRQYAIDSVAPKIQAETIRLEKLPPTPSPSKAKKR
jgi:hypothetical protein